MRSTPSTSSFSRITTPTCSPCAAIGEATAEKPTAALAQAEAHALALPAGLDITARSTASRAPPSNSSASGIPGTPSTARAKRASKAGFT